MENECVSKNRLKRMVAKQSEGKKKIRNIYVVLMHVHGPLANARWLSGKSTHTSHL